MANELLTRRRFLGGLTGAALGLLVCNRFSAVEAPGVQTGVELISTPEPLALPKAGTAADQMGTRFNKEQMPARFYRGAVRPLKERPLINPERLKGIFRALFETGHPFVGKITLDMDRVMTSKFRPEDFPSFVRYSSPIPVTYDPEFPSLPAVWRRLNADKESRFKFKTGKFENEYLQMQVLAMGINVAPSGLEGEGGLLAEGLSLLSSYAAHMVGLRSSLEYWDIVKNYELGQFTAMDGGAIGETMKFTVGTSAYYQQMLNGTSDFWKVFQTFPLFLAGSVSAGLVRSGKLPEKLEELRVLNTASEHLKENQQAEGVVARLMSQWTNQGTFLPPEHTLALTATGLLLNASKKLYDELWPGTVNPNHENYV